MRNSIAAVICTILSVIVVILLCVGVKNYNLKQNEISSEYENYSVKLTEIESRKKEAEETILRLDEQINAAKAPSTISLLILGMSTDIYDVLFPVTEEYGIDCTLVMTGDHLPGKDGILNDSQILNMVSSGWSIIPGYADGDGDNGIVSSAKWISDYGYDHGNTVFIEEKYLTEEKRTLLKAAGYTTVILGEENGTVDHMNTDPIGDVWYPYAIGYNSIDHKQILNLSIEQKGALFFTVSFEGEYTLYSESLFPSMLSYINQCISNSDLIVTSVPAAREMRFNAETLIYQINSENATLRAENEKIIVAADAEIKDLYEKNRSVFK